MTDKMIGFVVLFGVIALLLFLAGVAFKITALLVGGSLPFLLVGYVLFLIVRVPSKNRKY